MQIDGRSDEHEYEMSTKYVHQDNRGSNFNSPPLTSKVTEVTGRDTLIHSYTHPHSFTPTPTYGRPNVISIALMSMHSTTPNGYTHDCQPMMMNLVREGGWRTNRFIASWSLDNPGHPHPPSFSLG